MTFLFASSNVDDARSVRGIAVLIAMTVGSWFSLSISSTVSASCGDYLSHERQSAVRSGAADIVPDQGPHGPQRPCDGPFCRQVPQDVPPATPLSLPASDEFACPVATPDWMTETAVPCDVNEFQATSLWIAFRLERPPKR